MEREFTFLKKSYYAGILVPIQHEFILNGKTEMSSQQTNKNTSVKIWGTKWLHWGGDADKI